MVHEVRSQQYERNAEPLPHVQHHTVFKGFLAGFYKLHKEAEGEYGSEAVSRNRNRGIAWFCTFYTTASL